MSLSWREPLRSRVLIALTSEAAHAVRLKDGERRTGPLKEVLAGWPRAEATVVLSNRLVRYAVVPRTAGVSGDAEEQALAHHHFTKVHGERARDWDVRYCRETGLASAIDKGLIAELKSLLKLKSLQPYLMSAFNSLRARVPAEGAWIVLPETGATCIALFAKGAWAGVSVSRASDDKVIERERLRMGNAQAPGTVLTPPGNDGYAMALCGK